MHFKAVIFDWGGVLIENPAPAMADFLSDFFGIDRELLLKKYDTAAAGFTTGKITENDLWKTLGFEIKTEMTAVNSLWLQAFNSAYAEKRKLHDLAEQLKNKGFYIGMLSNTEPPVADSYSERGYSFIDVPVFSCVEGMAKPDPGIYRITAERLKVLPQECIYTDDKLEYVQAARAVGMEGIHFTDTAECIGKIKGLTGLDK